MFSFALFIDSFSKIEAITKKNESKEKSESGIWKAIPIAVAVVIVGVSVGIVIYKKKK